MRIKLYMEHRRWIGLLAWIAAVLWPSLSSAQSIAGTWKINGNGYPGDLAIAQAPDGTLSGSMYTNHTLRGYYAPGERTVVILRIDGQGPAQAFVGKVSTDEKSMSGHFYGLSSGSNGIDRNEFYFSAAKVTGSSPAVPAPLPALGPLKNVASAVVPNLGINGNGWDGRLTIDSMDGAGVIRGHVYNEIMQGQYAREGTIAFIRYYNNAPYQLYVGRGTSEDADHLVATGFVGDFYALTPGAGASSARMRYDWYTYPLALPAEICGDGFDNDRDGLVDWSDLDCSRPELCNSFDDDHNGRIDDSNACHRVKLSFSNIDDDAVVSFLPFSDFREVPVCNLKTGAYPRRGECDLSAFMATKGNPPLGTFRVRFGNGGGGWSSGSMDIVIDSRVMKTLGVVGAYRSNDWFFDQQMRIDFSQGLLLWP